MDQYFHWKRERRSITDLCRESKSQCLHLCSWTHSQVKSKAVHSDHRCFLQKHNRAVYQHQTFERWWTFSSMMSSVEILERFSLAINLKELYLYLNGLAPPAERFQSLCNLVSTSSQARYYVWCRMCDDVRLSLLVFFNLYLGLHVDTLNYCQQIHNTSSTVW